VQRHTQRRLERQQRLGRASLQVGEAGAEAVARHNDAVEQLGTIDQPHARPSDRLSVRVEVDVAVVVAAQRAGRVLGRYAVRVDQAANDRLSATPDVQLVVAKHKQSAVVRLGALVRVVGIGDDNACDSLHRGVQT
jgi:hypothetical protein